MNYNNRGNQQIYGTGCSLVGCIVGLLILGFIIRGSIFFFFRYFWLILILGIVVWVFRKFVHTGNDSNTSRDQRERRGQDWHRDFENRQNTAYHNIDRDFEEVDEEDEENEDEFKDF